jgi:Polyketide cyclase / dehydrase and lipid transport
MMRRFLLSAAILAALAPVSLAHGPTRQKVAETVEINAPAEMVWARIGNFQDMSWLPAVAKTEGQGGNEVDKATRKLILQGDGTATIDEQLYKYDATKMSYSYRITKVDVKVFPVNDYSSHITVKAVDANKSIVEWRGAFYRGYMNNDPPPELNDEASVAAVKGVYRLGLDALKKELEAAN